MFWGLVTFDFICTVSSQRDQSFEARPPLLELKVKPVTSPPHNAVFVRISEYSCIKKGRNCKTRVHSSGSLSLIWTTGGFYQDSVGYSGPNPETGCKLCAIGTYVPPSNAPGTDPQHCKACPVGRLGENNCFSRKEVLSCSSYFISSIHS